MLGLFRLSREYWDNQQLKCTVCVERYERFYFSFSIKSVGRNNKIFNCLGSLSELHPPYDISDLEWGWWVLQIGTPLLLIIGITGNSLSVIVLKSRRFRTKSYSHYLCTLAVFDSLVLINKYMHRLDELIMVTGNSRGVFGGFSDAMCKMHNYAEHVCYLMSSWLILCMTSERYVAVNHPFKKDAYCRPRNAVTVILVVFAVMSYSQIFRLILIENFYGTCSAPDRYRHAYVALHIYFYQIVLQFLVPSLLILLLNLRILRKIYALRSHLYRNNFVGSTQGTLLHGGNGSGTGSIGGGASAGVDYARHARQQRNKTTCMLLAVSFIHIVSLLPLVIVSVVAHTLTVMDPESGAIVYDKLYNVTKLLELFSEFNYSCNFYIYVLSGVQFRYTLRNICSARKLFFQGSSGHHHHHHNHHQNGWQKHQNHQQQVFYFRKFEHSNS